MYKQSPRATKNPRTSSFRGESPHISCLYYKLKRYLVRDQSHDSSVLISYQIIKKIDSKVDIFSRCDFYKPSVLGYCKITYGGLKRSTRNCSILPLNRVSIRCVIQRRRETNILECIKLRGLMAQCR